MKKNAREARLSLTKATSAVILGLALAATPTFALAAQDPAATQAGSADGAQAQAEVGQDIDSGKALFNYLMKGGVSSNNTTTQVNLDTVTTINLTKAGQYNPGWYENSPLNFFNPGNGGATGSNTLTVVVNEDLTINGVDNAAGVKGGDVYISYINFVVKNGATLTLNNVNIDDNRNAGSGHTTDTPVIVENGGHLVTTGTGDMVSNNGEDGDNDHRGYNVVVKSGGVADLGAKTSGYEQRVHDNLFGGSNAPDLPGNYASRANVYGEEGSTVNITAGNFVVEQFDNGAIDSRGTVNIKGDLDESGNPTINVSTLKLSGSKAKLTTDSVSFGLINPHGDAAEQGVDNQKGDLMVADGATAYLTSTAVQSIASSVANEIHEGSGAKPAIFVDGASKVYMQDPDYDLENPGDRTSGDDQSAVTDLKVAYEGDHLTSNQYYASGVIRSDDNSVKSNEESVTNAGASRGLWIVPDDADHAFNDLEGQLSAKDIQKLTAATETSGVDADGINISTVKAEIPLGKYRLFGRYEIAHNDTTLIQGKGHVYEVSPARGVQAGWDVSKYRSESDLKAPAVGDEASYKYSDIDGVEFTQVVDSAPEGYVFAGWYTKGGDLRTGGASNDWGSSVDGIAALQKAEDPASKYELGKDVKTGYAYAKFVPATLLNARAQFKVNGDNSKIRFLTGLDSYNYSEVGFTVTDENGKQIEGKNLTSDMAYDYVLANTNGKPDTKAFAADYFDTTSTTKEQLPLLFARGYIDGLPANYSGTFNVTGYWVTADGTKVTGDAVAFTVDGNGGLEKASAPAVSLAGTDDATN